MTVWIAYYFVVGCYGILLDVRVIGITCTWLEILRWKPPIKPHLLPRHFEVLTAITSLFVVSSSALGPH